MHYFNIHYLWYLEPRKKVLVRGWENAAGKLRQKRCKQQQEQNWPNHVQWLFSGSLSTTNNECWNNAFRLCILCSQSYFGFSLFPMCKRKSLSSLFFADATGRERRVCKVFSRQPKGTSASRASFKMLLLFVLNIQNTGNFCLVRFNRFKWEHYIESQIITLWQHRSLSADVLILRWQMVGTTFIGSQSNIPFTHFLQPFPSNLCTSICIACAWLHNGMELRYRLSDSFAPFKCYPLPSMLITKKPGNDDDEEEVDYSELATYRDALLQESNSQPFWFW